MCKSLVDSRISLSILEDTRDNPQWTMDKKSALQEIAGILLVSPSSSGHLVTYIYLFIYLSNVE